MSKKEDTQIWEMSYEAKFIKFAWKFGTQNLVATCTLNLSWNLGHFPKSILGNLYIFQSSRSQDSNASNGVQIRAKTRKSWVFETN